MDAAAFETWLNTQAETPLALDVAKFKTDLKSDAIVQKTLQFQADAQAAGVTYTPFIMVNGRVWEGIDLNNMRILVKLLREDKNITPGCPPTVLEAWKTIHMPQLKPNWVILSSNFRGRRFHYLSMLSSGSFSRVGTTTGHSSTSCMVTRTSWRSPLPATILRRVMELPDSASLPRSCLI